MQDTDPISLIYKIQRILDEIIDNNASVIIGGGVDNMDKYNYILGKIHVSNQIKQEISNLLNPKEPNDDDDKVTPIRS
tara:strand:- start:330 stop:563 length:234 start_codon:yes stop_codon:yes gene_type:complete